MYLFKNSPSLLVAEKHAEEYLEAYLRRLLGFYGESMKDILPLIVLPAP